MANAKIIKLKMLYERATRANYDDPYRRGQLIELPAEGDVLLSGDLHGNQVNYHAILERAALDSFPKRHLIIQEVTHILELGPDTSSVVIEAIAKLKLTYPDRVHFLLGNHEHAELTGQEVMKGGVCLNILFRNSLINKYGAEEADNIRQAIYTFFRSMPLAIKTPNRLWMSHSTPDKRVIPRYSMDFFTQSTDDLWKDISRKLVYHLLWSRDYAQEAADAFAKIVDADVLLVGHKPCKKGYLVPNHTHIIVDSKDKNAHVLPFRLDRPYTHEELVKLVEPLEGSSS